MRRFLALTLLASACASIESPEPTLSPTPVTAKAESPKCGDHAQFATTQSPHDAARLYLEQCGLDETVALASALIAFPTVSAHESPKDGAAFREMAAYLETWSKEAGLEFRVSGANDAWEIAYGAGAPSVAFVMHGDVVPASEKAIEDMTAVPAGWTRPPFVASVEKGRLYGRGSEDDKAPIAAILVIMRTLSKLGIQPSGRILAMIGTGEEKDWDGMKRYVDSIAKPQFVISLDSSFPVVVAESGFVAWQLTTPITNKRVGKPCVRVEDAHAGEFLTQVPGDAFALFVPHRGETRDALMTRLGDVGVVVAKESDGKLRVELAPEGKGVAVRVFGEAVHSSVADEGANALWGLSKVAHRVGVCQGGLGSMLEVVSGYFADDHWGEKLGLAYSHETMGKLLVVPAMLRVEGKQAQLSINMRRPAGQTNKTFADNLDKTLTLLKKDVDPALQQGKDRYIGDAAIANVEGPLVTTLLEIYKREYGDAEAKVTSIRGGTYARLFDGSVSFGPALPNAPYRGHAPDEFIELDALLLVLRTSFEAAWSLDAMTSKAQASLQ